LKELSADLEEKIEAILAENKALKQQVEQYRQAYDILQSQVKELMRQRFGQRSARFIDPNDPQQGLFNDLENPADNATALDSDTTDVPAHKRRKKKEKNTDHLPRTVVTIPVEAADKICACGCEKTVIRYEGKELHDYQPAVFQIIDQRREVVACPKGCDAST
jgi:transposase